MKFQQFVGWGRNESSNLVTPQRTSESWLTSKGTVKPLGSSLNTHREGAEGRCDHLSLGITHLSTGCAAETQNAVSFRGTEKVFLRPEALVATESDSLSSVLKKAL